VPAALGAEPLYRFGMGRRTGTPLGKPPSGLPASRTAGAPVMPSGPPPYESTAGEPETNHVGARGSWKTWEVVVVVAAAILVGLLIGVVVGSRLEDPENTAASAGSADDPVGLGVEHSLGGGWAMRVTGVDPDASDVIEDLRDANEPPGPNESYVLVTTEMRYAPLSGGSVANADPQSVLAWLIDDRGIPYFGYQHSCGYFPNPVFTHPPLAPGDMIEVNHCWAVPTDRVDQMLLVASSPAGSSDEHFALR
jgi:hypothetical protein